MPHLQCSDFDEFAQALRGVDGRYLLTGSTTCDWRLQVVELDGVTLMVGQDGAANLFHASCQAGVHSLFVPLESAGGVAVNGERLAPSNVSWLVPGSEFHMRAGGAQQWIAVMIEDAAPGAATVLDDAVLAMSACTHSGRALPQSIAHLRVLSSRLFQRQDGPLDERSTAVVRHQLLQATHSVVHSMHGTRQERRGRPSLSRQLIVDRAINAIDARLDQPIQLSELSKWAGVSERTIRSVFREQFGVSPHRYIAMRRMHGIHSAIRSAASQDTVSDICGRFGVWDFGRFARSYRQQFGVSPSSMLEMTKRK